MTQPTLFVNEGRRFLAACLCLLPYYLAGVLAQEVNTDCDVGPDALASIPAPQTCIDVGGKSRCWYTYTPPTSTNAVPLVLNLHGFSDCAKLATTYTGWAGRAVRDGFVLVWPQGTTDLSVTATPCFDGGNCCCIDETGGPVQVPDVEFIRQVIADTVEASPVPIDTKRIYIAGHSNGCIMANRIAAELSGIIAAMCCHSGMAAIDLLSLSGVGYRPTPVSLIHGDMDDIVPYGGGGSPGLSGAEENLAAWAELNGCKSEVNIVEDDSKTYATHSYSECNENKTVQLVQLYGVKHQPFKQLDVVQPGTENLFETDIDTTQMSQDFCFQFSNEAEITLPPCTGCNNTDHTPTMPTASPVGGSMPAAAPVGDNESSTSSSSDESSAPALLESKKVVTAILSFATILVGQWQLQA